MKKSNLKQLISKKLSENDKVVGAYIVGSYIQGSLRNDSDFDLVVVVENKNKTRVDEVYNLLQNVEFPKNLDLSVVDKSSSPLFLFQVIGKGENIYNRKKSEIKDFERKVIKKFYDTQHIRNIYYYYTKEKFINYGS